jgi:hypothetical protein
LSASPWSHPQSMVFVYHLRQFNYLLAPWTFQDWSPQNTLDLKEQTYFSWTKCRTRYPRWKEFLNCWLSIESPPSLNANFYLLSPTRLGSSFESLIPGQSHPSIFDYQTHFPFHQS